MLEPKVDTKVRPAGEGVSIIDIAGEVNAYAERPLMDAYSEATSQGARTIILNFDNLEYMNSTGIGLLVTLLIRVKRNQQRLLACGLNQHYSQIFELTRLSEAIQLCETEEEALALAEA